MVFLVKNAICPNSVFTPVAVTTALPHPSSTTVPIKTILSLSANGVFLSKIPMRLSAVSHSPVRIDSLIFKLSASMSRPSEGALSPGFKTIISPGAKF